jgi:hypothetical protein
MNFPRYSTFAACLLPLLAACGGTITGGPGNDSGTGSDGGTGSDSGTGSDTGTGTDGQPPPASCPTDPPTAGASCTDNGLECEYGTNPNVECNKTFTCAGSLWTSPSSTPPCPPADDCPPAYITSGKNEQCSMSDEDLTCSYAQGTCICSEGSLPEVGGPYWNCIPATSSCPSPRPRLGSACSDEGTQCDYGACEGGIAIECKDGVWQQNNMVACPATAGGAP